MPANEATGERRRALQWPAGRPLQVRAEHVNKIARCIAPAPMQMANRRVFKLIAIARLSYRRWLWNEIIGSCLSEMQLLD